MHVHTHTAHRTSVEWRAKNGKNEQLWKTVAEHHRTSCQLIAHINNGLFSLYSFKSCVPSHIYIYRVRERVRVDHFVLMREHILSHRSFACANQIRYIDFHGLKLDGKHRNTFISLITSTQTKRREQKIGFNETMTSKVKLQFPSIFHLKFEPC